MLTICSEKEETNIFHDKPENSTLQKLSEQTALIYSRGSQINDSGGQKRTATSILDFQYVRILTPCPVSRVQSSQPSETIINYYHSTISNFNQGSHNMVIKYFEGH